MAHASNNSRAEPLVGSSPRATPIVTTTSQVPAHITLISLLPNDYNILLSFLSLLTRRKDDGTRASFTITSNKESRAITITDAPGVPYGDGLRECLKHAKSRPKCLPPGFRFAPDIAG